MKNYIQHKNELLPHKIERILSSMLLQMKWRMEFWRRWIYLKVFVPFSSTIIFNVWKMTGFSSWQDSNQFRLYYTHFFFVQIFIWLRDLWGQIQTYYLHTAVKIEKKAPEFNCYLNFFPTTNWILGSRQGFFFLSFFFTFQLRPFISCVCFFTASVSPTRSSHYALNSFIQLFWMFHPYFDNDWSCHMKYSTS